MNPFVRAAVHTVFFAALTTAQSISAANPNILSDPTLNDITYSGSAPLSKDANGNTIYFGQFGSYQNSTLAVNGWTTSGYNFVFSPNTVDTGTKTSGANAGQPNEAPGAYNIGGSGVNAAYGSTYLWGSNNGGASTWPTTNPFGGNFFAADGAFGVGAISQPLTGLQIGRVYTMSFVWGAGQQQGYDGATTESWQVTVGNATYNTSTFNLASHNFSGWMSASFNFVPTSTTSTLSFLAQGTPNGEPPFLLMAAPSLSVAPEPSSGALLGGLGALGALGWLVRRRRRLAQAE